MTALHLLSLVALAVYAAAVVTLAGYAMHSLWLLGAFLRRWRARAAASRREDSGELPEDRPIILVQLPVFNERDVLARVVEAAGQLRWPRDRLRIQLLDDSTDDSVELGQRAIAALVARGLDATLVHRRDRTGFKAGALDHGLTLDAAHPGGAATFVAIFDADFVPPEDFLERAIRPFLDDPGLALVQGRWEHLNRDHNTLTRAQAVGIDAHFAIEQGARAWSGLPMNFNGTCGMWRVSAIHAAGGWEHDTLTEDMDLSYRAQLGGWRCAYRLDLAVPGEIPTTVAAWRAQQFRWAKGSIQTARKLLPRVWRSPWSLRRKIAATFHTTHYLVHPLIVISLVVAPVALPALRTQPASVLVVGALLFLIGVTTPLTLYVASQLILRGNDAGRYLRDYPRIMAIGTGLAISNTRAVWQALRGQASPFVRTPKQGDQPTSSYRARIAGGGWELLAAGWASVGAVLGASGAHPWLGGVLAIYAFGFAWMGLRMRKEHAIERPDPVAPAARLGWAVALGGVLVAGMSALVVLEQTTGGWRARPIPATLIGLGLGGAYLLATKVLAPRHPGRSVQIVIGAVAVAMRLVALPLQASDDVNRYVVEGAQVAEGENPYAVAPADTALEPSIVAGVNHPTWTAIYPPGTLLLEAAVVHVHGAPFSFKLLMLIAELIGLALVLALLARRRAPSSLIIGAAWCPLAPIWGAGEGHHDVVMATLLAAGLLAATTRPGRGLLWATTACLVKPFALVGLLAIGMRARWVHWLAAATLVIVAYLPFVGAGAGLFRSLGRFGAEKHFHGVLEPSTRSLLSLVGDPALAARATPLILAGVWLLSSGLIFWSARRRAASPIATTIALYVALLVCAPTLHPWYLVPLALLAPLTSSWALRVWLATAPVYWLHALAFDGPTGWAELGWVTTLAHVPAALVLIGEVWWSRPRVWRLPSVAATGQEKDVIT